MERAEAQPEEPADRWQALAILAIGTLLPMAPSALPRRRPAAVAMASGATLRATA